MSPVRILIADDHAVFRRSLRTLIESHPDWRVCGEAVDGEDAIHKFKELQPDVVLMDVSMPRMNGLMPHTTFCRPSPTQMLLSSARMTRK